MAADISTSWANRLGLVASSLFGEANRRHQGCHHALLDGVAGSFVLSEYNNLADQQEVPGATGADWSWSCAMRHYIVARPSEVVVTNSQKKTSERFTKVSVENRLEDFLAYLEASPQSEGPDAIDHIIRCFQNLRAEIGGPPEEQLASFLALTALRLENTHADVGDLPDCLGELETVARRYNVDPTQLSNRISERDLARRFYEDLLVHARGSHRLHVELTIRHASGELFQAAHLAPAPPPSQSQMFGLPAVRVRPHSLKGIAYTPIGLARSLAEQAIESVRTQPDTDLVILDPACGSGTFLIEAIEALSRRGWQGPVKLIGYDISRTAIAAARFALSCALRDQTTMLVDVDLQVANFLDPNFTPATAHVTIMNPPYLSWADMDNEQRKELRVVLGGDYYGRPDRSMAFVDRAVDLASEGGVVATLLPVGVLAGEYAKRWRDKLARVAPPMLIATLGDHTLFRFATVNISALILRKNCEPETTTMIWASEVPGAASASLRSIRRKRDGQLSDFPATINSAWTVYSAATKDAIGRPTWLPAPGLVGPALARFKRATPTTISDLFSVKLGVRAGNRDVFVISEDQYKLLPRGERAGFKPVAEKEGIDAGTIHATTYLFWMGEDIDHEEKLRARFPTYYERFLLPNRVALAQRQRVDPARWWKLAEARNTWRESREPRIVSRRWVRNNGYAVDADGSFAVVQGYAWFPQQALRSDAKEYRRVGELQDILRAYCIMFSSDVFFRIVREFSTNASGGQVDLQQKYLKFVPVPSLPSIIATDRQLGLMADSFDPNDFPSLSERNKFAALCYQIDIDEA